MSGYQGPYAEEIRMLYRLMREAPTQAVYEAADDLLVALGAETDEGWDAQEVVPSETLLGGGGPRGGAGRCPVEEPPGWPWGSRREES